jgi:hypothetical protein
MKTQIDGYIRQATEALEQVTKDMPIVGSELWNECKKQVLLEGTISELKVNGSDLLKTFKRKIDRYKGGLKSKIRNNPQLYNIDKITKDAVDDIMLCDTNVMALEDAYDKAERVVELVKAAYDQLMNRKSMLRDMISMYTSAYWRDSLDGERNKVLECMLNDVSVKIKNNRKER